MVLQLTIQAVFALDLLVALHAYNMGTRLHSRKLTFYNEDNFLFYPTYLFNLNLYNK